VRRLVMCHGQDDLGLHGLLTVLARASHDGFSSGQCLHSPIILARNSLFDSSVWCTDIRY
jgi:hypothetical protein